VLRHLVHFGVPLEQFEVAMPTLDEIFIRVVSQAGESLPEDYQTGLQQPAQTE
jgi:hypothetical protein